MKNAHRIAKWIECNGEAHRNPYIDNCMVCLPYWGKYPICPDCGNWKLKQVERKDGNYVNLGFCKGCRKHYTLHDDSGLTEKIDYLAEA